MTASLAATARIEVGADHPAFDGHFPGQPILPGVALLAMVLEVAAQAPAMAAAIGPAPVLAVVKFAAPVGPGTSLVVALRAAASAVDWRIDDDRGRTVASGRFARADVARPSA